ncbi:MAG: hypothetical protein JF585_03620 [Burkholderiales bacterium]|nr:hypothetical protein [Burkholderiales bacterium]
MTAPTASDLAAAALATAAAPSDADTADAVAQLADVAGHASTVLFNWRRDNPAAADVDRALNLEMTLDQRAIDLRGKAVKLLGAQAADAIAQIQDAAQKVDTFLGTVKKTGDRLAIASAVVGLAGAALVGDAGGVLQAVVSVHGALKDARA